MTKIPPYLNKLFEYLKLRELDLLEKEENQIVTNKLEEYKYIKVFSSIFELSKSSNTFENVIIYIHNNTSKILENKKIDNKLKLIESLNNDFNEIKQCGGLEYFIIMDNNIYILSYNQEIFELKI